MGMLPQTSYPSALPSLQRATAKPLRISACLAVAFALTVMAACSSSDSKPQIGLDGGSDVGNCADFSEGKGQCNGDSALQRCEGDRLVEYQCPAGAVCDVEDEIPSCYCTTEADGLCPGSECTEDPDCSESEALACDSYAFCTYFDSADVDLEMPATLGGPIVEGVYRAEEGGFMGVWVFRGNQILRVSDSYSNELGTYTTDGNGALDFVFTEDCRGNSNETIDYELNGTYAIMGNALYYQCTGCNVVEKMIRVDELCEESPGFACTVNPEQCQCHASVGVGLPVTTGNGFDKCELAD